MCWPEADKPYDDFIKALKEFKRSLTDILILNQSRNSKYIKIHEDDNAGHIVLVYLQRKTHNIVKVVVNYSVDGKQYGSQVVTLSIDDEEIEDKITNLSFIGDITSNIEKVRDIMYADQVMGKLTYG